jgi:predicted nucleic acid-binding protein
VNLIFADTFYFLALLNQGDAAHQKARTVSEQLTNPILTTAWVLTEVADALATPNLRQVFLSLMENLRSDPSTTIVAPSHALFEQGLNFYAERPDKDWTLTDCISFVVMQQYGITEALTGDHHFEQAGFRALLR